MAIALVYQEGNRVDHTAGGTAIPAGDVVVVATTVKGVATSEIPANTAGSLDASYGRIFECDITPLTPTVGQMVYVNPAGGAYSLTTTHALFGRYMGNSERGRALIRAMFALLVMFCFGATSGFAQQICPDGKCDLVQDPQTVSTAVADTPHCRCLVSGSCGSGTICGADDSGAYVLSNAHVWGTQISKVVNVDIVQNGQRVRLQGRLVFAGYSSSRMVDFAIALVPGLTSKRYMPLLKTEPEAAPYSTTGSPQCVWPQVTKPFNDPRNYGQGLITGSPDAIGGQSGSAIYNSRNEQIALLTWSISGRCAGQKTSKLWEVATQRNVNVADLRPEGLKELNNTIVCEEGVFGSLPGLKEVSNENGGPRVRPITEDMIANVVSQNMATMPIWVTPKQPEPTPEPGPGSDCYKLSEKEWELIQFLRAQAEQRKDGQRAIPWLDVIRLLMQLLELFNK